MFGGAPNDVAHEQNSLVSREELRMHLEADDGLPDRADVHGSVSDAVVKRGSPAFAAELFPSAAPRTYPASVVLDALR